MTANAHASDIPALCLANARHEVLGSTLLGIPQETLLKGSSEQIATAAGLKDTSPWILLDGDLITQTRAAYLVQKNIATKIIASKFKDLNLVQVINDAATGPAHYSEQGLSEARKILKSYRNYNPDSGLDAVLGGLSAPIACARYFDPLCAGALDALLVHMDPQTTTGYNGAFVSLPSVITRLETDDTLVQGAAIFTKKIMKWMDEENPNLNGFHLFSELKASYESAGFKPKQAEEKTWTLLAFYGSRGASMTSLQTLITRETLPLHLSLYLFSAALGTLDHLTLESGHPFSYPEQIQTGCYYGRPYHFWLSAYLAHHLNKTGFPKWSAVIATHLSGKLYEFDARTIDRVPTRIYNFKPKSDPVLSTEKNIAFNDAGAAWAVESTALFPSTRLFNVDANFETLITESRELPEFTKAQKERLEKYRLYRYPYFERLIAPDAALMN